MNNKPLFWQGRMLASGDYRRILLLILVMIAVVLAVSATAIGLLYQTSLQQQKERLAMTAKSYSLLIEAVAKFDMVYSEKDHPEGAKAATLSQIAGAHDKLPGFGKTGEIILAEMVGDRIVYLLDYRFPARDGIPVPKSLPFKNGHGEPMRRALMGHSGALIGPDYRGVKVLAAYEPVAVYDFGVVAKIDMAEIRAPFARAAASIAGVVFLAIGAGVAIFFWVGNPMVRQILESEKELRHARDKLEKKVAERTRELKEEVAFRSRAEQVAIERSVELERSNANLEQFAYVASHDLQEPLRMVSSYVQLLQRKLEGRLGRDESEFMAYIREGAARMHYLINDLLIFSRLHRPDEKAGTVESAAALRLALENLAAAIGESKAIINAGPLPVVRAEQGQLVMLLQNLIGNAVKFRSKDRAPEIHVGAKKIGEEWLFSVRDNGIGISPEYRERVFIIFQRLHSRAAYDGTGIGLALCKKIVEQHGGRIWVDGDQGGGSVFFFTLPAA